MTNCYENYYGLIFNCPVGKDLNGCEYKIIRKLSTKERLAYYSALTEEEKDKLIEKHQVCLSLREKKTLFHESQ